MTRKFGDDPQYDSELEEAADYEDGDQGDNEQEQATEEHHRLLKQLVDGTPLHEIPSLELENQHTGKCNMTILHLLLSDQHYRRLSFSKIRRFLDKLLNADPKRVKEFLSSRDINGQTALALAVSGNGRDIQVLSYLLQREEALEAAEVQSDSGWNCLHELSSRGSSRNLQYIEDCLKLILSSKSKKLITSQNKLGETPLHLAVKYKRQANPGWQLKLTSQLIDACPELLKIVNKNSRSPYQYRLDTLRAIETNPSSNNDDIAWFMRNCYMHFKDRGEAVKYLYGKEDEELSMEIDLSEHSVYTFSLDSLTSLSQHWKFENILRYVYFPKVNFKNPSTDIYPVKDTSKKQGQSQHYNSNDEGIGRKDLQVMFDWLRNNRGVKKIIEVRVLDNEDPPHSDEIIEKSLKNFDVEVLNWFKFDLCSETILKAAPNVQEVHLYSSGNNAVLHAWSGCDGLAKLSKLKKVYIVIYQRLETYQRTQTILDAFKDRLKAHIDGIVIEEEIKKYSASRGNGLAGTNSVAEGGSTLQTQTWTKHMDTFVSFIVNIPADKERKIRVALIDNGVDGSYSRLGQIIKLGTSHCSHPHRHGQLNNYCTPSKSHGTQMASLISQICPKIELYVARILDMEAEDSRQIDVESVVKAINWAVDHKVDIISMSWTIERTEDNKTVLDKGLATAISRAYGERILMFCSTDDQGGLSKDDVYPGCLPGTFKIGAAKPSGNEGEWTDKGSYYTFPGEDLKVHLPPYLTSDNDKLASGSSLATALASGMAALLLYCVQIVHDNPKTPPETSLQDARTYNNMDRAFKRMTDKNKQPRYIRAWEHLNPEFKEFSKAKGIDELRRVMMYLFK
ncbi:hypothetical protein HOY82DRAFT_560245 [Tuber indicum]|nr:hypothetical protein HOY82DRAFT_560245 [Tuber indicum]